MYKLLSRFAWIISIMIWIQFSFIIDRDWPFDFEWFFVFVIVLIIVKFTILPENFIKSRLEFFAESLQRQYIWNNSNFVQENNTNNTIKKDDLELLTEENNNLELSSNKKDIFDKPQEEVVVINTPEIVYETESIKTEEKTQEVEESKIVLYIKKFFSENLLAKLGSILVFLWVLFLLGLVYTKIWAVWKLIIWFAIWFWIYFAWVILEKKNYKNEWKILLWSWILINYLVILSWKYLIWDNINDNILSTWATFLFLIFNTVFAVVTSLVYNSRTLLLFSFIFAFINPLLVWWSSNDPSTIIGYSLIVASWWLYLSLKQKDIILAIWVFILSNILFLIAPFSTDLHWVAKLITSTFISISSIFTIYNIDKAKLSTIFIWSYIFLMLLLWTWETYIKETTSFISYMISIILFFGIWIYFFLKTNVFSLVYILFAPILIILWIWFAWWLASIILTLAIIVFLYLLGFTFIQDKLPNFLKYIFFIILWFYIFLTNSLLSIQSMDLSMISFITVLIISFIFIFTSYYLSTKKDLEFLYSIWTIWWILTLTPILITQGENSSIIQLSILWLIIFTISNWALPFINENLLNKQSNLKNLIIWMITWLLFIWFELFNYWNIYFSWITLGLSFFFIAIIYFFMAYAMIWKIWIETVKTDDASKNVIYSYLWISISIFSLAIALVFSNYGEIITSVWLFEATIMFYFYNKTKESKIFIAWVILFMIWVFKLFNLVDIVNSKDYIFLIPFILVYTSLLLNLKFLDSIQENTKRFFHDFLHILWIWTLAILLLEIIPSTWTWWSILWISIFLTLSSIIYAYFNSTILKIFFIISLSGFFLLHIWESESIFRKIDNKGLEHLRILQYISTALLWTWIIFWNKINKKSNLNILISIVSALYILIITSIYVYDIFNTTFAVTIYWWIAASVMLFHWLAKDIIKLRTIWLYLVSLTALKIFLYDIWFGIDDAISRVVALIVIWILFIIISTRYTKKFWNNINKEFSFDNFKENKSTDNNNKKNTTKQNTVKQDNNDSYIENKVIDNNHNNFIINRQINEIKVWNTSSVQLIFKNEKINLRAINLIKIVKLVINSYNWQTRFKAGELKDIYDYIIENYKSDLSRDNYKKIIMILEKFIEEWWEIKLIEKK